jgi:hypothetical protein
MSDDVSSKSIPERTYLEIALIALCLVGGVALLALAWILGDATPEAQTRQWQLVFLSFSLTLAGQWIVSGSPFAKKQQIAATCLVLAGAGVGVQHYYGLAWTEFAPFIVGYLFLFAAAELCAFIGAGQRASRRTIHAVRIGVVAWNAGWGVSYAASAYALPDIANLYVAFSLLWTFATAVIAWSEFCVVAEADPRQSDGDPRRPDAAPRRPDADPRKAAAPPPAAALMPAE